MNTTSNVTVTNTTTEIDCDLEENEDLEECERKWYEIEGPCEDDDEEDCIEEEEEEDEELSLEDLEA